VLALRHDDRALGVGIALALVEGLIGLAVVRDPYLVVATLTAIIAGATVRALSGQGADRARFDSVAYTDFLTNCPIAGLSTPSCRTGWRRRGTGRPRWPSPSSTWTGSAPSTRTGATPPGTGCSPMWPRSSGLPSEATPTSPASRTRRVGNDEFAVVLERLTTTGVAEMIRDVETDLPAGCTVSVGIAFWIAGRPRTTS